MDKYIQQLIADIYEAQNKSENASNSDMSDTGHFFSKIEHEEDPEYYSPAVKAQFGNICGIKKLQFPPVELLTENQTEAVCEAIDRLLFSWNIYADLPDALPASIAYELLTEIFEEEIEIVNVGQIGIEFCDSIPQDCAFGEYCECKKIDEAIALRERTLGNSILKLISKIRTAPQNLPDPDVFSLIYPDSESSGKAVGPLKPIREWLGFTIDFFPNPDDLTEVQMDAVSDALLMFMNEQFQVWVENISPKLRYISLVEYLNIKAQYNGKGGFFLDTKPPVNLNDFKKNASGKLSRKKGPRDL